MIKIVVPIVPKPQARARHAVRCGHALAYKAKHQKDAEQTLQAYLLPHQPDIPIDGPVCLVIKAFLPIPKSKPKWWRESALAGRIVPTKKPDVDNLAKQVCDCCTNMRFWEDDKQITDLTAQKFYSDRPRWEIFIDPVESEKC